MAILTPTQAAKAAGIGRSTLYRYLREGKLSATPLPTGGRGIDTAELERVFGPLRQTGTTRDVPPEHSERAKGQPETSQRWGETHAFLHQQVLFLEQELIAAREERNRLLTLLEQKMLPEPASKHRKKKKRK